MSLSGASLVARIGSEIDKKALKELICIQLSPQGLYLTGKTRDKVRTPSPSTR